MFHLDHKFTKYLQDLMPLYQTIQIKPNTTVYVWKITEDIEVLRDIYLSENSINRLKNMKSEQHQKGFLSIRHLLQQLNINDDELIYNKFGKPILKNVHISITHSYDFSAIVISDKLVGIDMEKNREKIKVIAHRFTDFDYQHLNNETAIQQLTFIWGGKESLYKIHPSGGMSFKHHLSLHELNFDNQTAIGAINTPEIKEEFDIHFAQIDNYGLALATTK